MPRIFTIGHSTHGAEQFVALLRRARIEVLADVRRVPGSRRFPHFGASELERALAAAGVVYVHLPELGGRRQPAAESPNTGWSVGQFRGYADHMDSEEFRRALGRLVALAERSRVVVMCAEAQWRRCHRRLLSDALLVAGFEVLHLGPRGEAEAHELTPFAVPEEGRLRYPAPQESLEV
jgi:uncharacterized protein (DUF488 family)